VSVTVRPSWGSRQALILCHGCRSAMAAGVRRLMDFIEDFIPLQFPLCFFAAHFQSRDSLLLVAVNYNQTGLVRQALAQGANPNAHQPCRHCRFNKPALVAASELGLTHIVELLLAHGAHPDITDFERYTPLILASMYPHMDTLRLLLAAGADPNLPGRHGRTALFAAASFGHLAAVDTLLAAGADPDIAVSPCATSVCAQL